jgi:hypothetical protein
VGLGFFCRAKNINTGHRGVSRDDQYARSWRFDYGFMGRWLMIHEQIACPRIGFLTIHPEEDKIVSLP